MAAIGSGSIRSEPRPAATIRAPIAAFSACRTPCDRSSNRRRAWRLAQVDIGAEEVGIAAGLSGDPVLQADYRSGDPYRQFAAAALGILKPTEQQRQIYKATVLGRIYGLGVASLARNLGISKAQAQRIIDQMNARYPVLNAWLKRVTTKAAHIVPIVCTLGWSLASSGRPGEERTFLNFPMQANGAELMRLVIVRAGAAGLRLIGCAHDSFMIEAPIARDRGGRRQAAGDHAAGLARPVGRFRAAGGLQARAGHRALSGRFIDKREMEDGMRHWNRLMELIGDKPKDEEVA